MTKACAYCGALGRMTRDHIIPKSAGGKWYLPCGSRNYRYVCRPCNAERALTGHCILPALLARDMAVSLGVKRQKIMMAMGYTGRPLQKEHWRRAVLETQP